jgi:hypothetical protein
MVVKRLLAGSGALLAAALLCAGCGTSGTPSTVVGTDPTTVTATTTTVKTVRSTSEQTVTVTVTAGGSGSTGSPADYPPADFYDYGNGVYGAFETDHTLFDCDDESNRCWGVRITAPAGCANGVAIKLTIYPKGSDVAASTVDQSSSQPLAAGEIKTIVVGSSKLPDDQQYEAEITQAGCA